MKKIIIIFLTSLVHVNTNAAITDIPQYITSFLMTSLLPSENQVSTSTNDSNSNENDKKPEAFKENIKKTIILGSAFGLASQLAFKDKDLTLMLVAAGAPAMSIIDSTLIEKPENFKESYPALFSLTFNTTLAVLPLVKCIANQ